MTKKKKQLLSMALAASLLLALLSSVQGQMTEVKPKDPAPQVPITIPGDSCA